MIDLLTDTSFWGVVASLVLMIITALAKAYLVPFLKVGKRERYARYIAIIADELTDDLRARYPEKEWLRHLDEAIDGLIDVCGISTEVAQRAVRAAAARK